MQEPSWNLPRLANWLDRGVDHPDITKPSAIVFITNALNALIGTGTSIDDIARNKYELRRSLRNLISDLRSERQTGNYDALFAASTDQFATSAELSMIFDEQTYAYNQPYAGATKFDKHYTSIVGDMKPITRAKK